MRTKFTPAKLFAVTRIKYALIHEAYILITSIPKNYNYEKD